MMGMDWIYTASTWVVPVLLAVTLHEAAHGFAAFRLGDPTAKLYGRLSLNPLRHVDPLGTVVVPLVLLVSSAPFLFGWAKPVPVDVRRLRNPRRDSVLVALAGPGANLVLATLSVMLLAVLRDGSLPLDVTRWTLLTLRNMLILNLVLAVFNMLPVPPLDGGRVAVGLLPRGPAMWLAGLERYGILLLIGVIFLLPMVGRQFGMDLNVFAWVIGVPVDFLMRMLLGLAGF